MGRKNEGHDDAGISFGEDQDGEDPSLQKNIVASGGGSTHRISIQAKVRPILISGGKAWHGKSIDAKDMDP